MLCAQETPDPWQSLDPFDSLDTKPFKKGNLVEEVQLLRCLAGFAGARVVGGGGAVLPHTIAPGRHGLHLCSDSPFAPR